MKNKGILRSILLVLTVVAVAAVAPCVGAELYSGDVNAVSDVNADGVYEISTAEGLYYMAGNPNLSYELTADIDLGGAQWTPISYFGGSLEGNGHTISNCVINSSVADVITSGEYNMGFFGSTKHESVIHDVHLRNVTVNADQNAKYIGVLLGTSRGTVTECTVTGGIYDTRESLNEGYIFVGVFAGRVTTGATASIEPSHTLSVTDDTGTYTVTGLCADMKMKVMDDSDLVRVGLVGWLPSGYSCAGQWVDTTYDSDQLSQTMQNRQDVVVDYMETMGTIPWQVSEDLDYIPVNGTGSVHRQMFKTGTIYYGIPYSNNAGSLERFMSKIDTSSGKNVTVEGLEDGYYNNGFYGFIQYMGNDCSSAVGWAWARVSPTRVNGASDTEYAGGTHVRYTINMVPNENAQSSRGIYPVGEWTTVSRNNDNIIGDFAYSVTTETDTEQIYNTNGKEVLAEAYAVTRKADALVYYSAVKKGGHARLVAADPVVIRNNDGSIDTNKSFFVTHEQGDGLYERAATNSSWRINYKYTFEDLLNTDYNTNDKSSGGVYVPITMRALRNDYVKHAYVMEYPDVPVVSPINGKIYSNFHIISSTVTVADAKGKVLYDNEVFTGISHIQDVTRGKFETVDLSVDHAEAFIAAARAAEMTAGTQYHFSVKVLLSNGTTMNVVTDRAYIAENGDTQIYIEPIRVESGAQVSVPAGQTQYYATTESEIIITVTGNVAFTLKCDGNSYSSPSLVVSTTDISGSETAPTVFSITNHSETDGTFTVTFTSTHTHNYSCEVTTPPTTVATGTLIGVCSGCSETITVTLPKLNTVNYTYKVTKDATCTSDGEGRYTWKNTTYGVFYFTVAIKTVPHSLGDWEVYTPATCTENGEERKHCANCDYYESQVIEAPGHDYENGVCSGCGETDPNFEPEKPKHNGIAEVDDIWGYYIDGELQTEFTGLVEFNGTWFYVENGIINWDYVGMTFFGGYWFYISGGYVEWNYTGLTQYNGYWFYIENGMVNWNYVGMTQFGGYWFYVAGGMVDWAYNSLTQYGGYWFYISGGMVDWDYVGLVPFNGALFYVQNGMVNWSYSGSATYNGTNYNVQNGIVVW